MGLSGRIGYILHILDCLGQVNAGFIQVLYLGRAPRTKETLPNFREKCRVTRHSRVFRGFTGSQRTPGFGASQCLREEWLGSASKGSYRRGLLGPSRYS